MNHVEYDRRHDEIEKKLAKHPAIKRLGLSFVGSTTPGFLPSTVLYFRGIGFSICAYDSLKTYQAPVHLRWEFAPETEKGYSYGKPEHSPRTAILKGLSRLDPLTALVVEGMLSEGNRP